MDTVTITTQLTMLRVDGWQLYVWRDDDSVTLIDTGAPGSGEQILSAVPGVDRTVVTHGHVDHIGSAAELHQATGAPVLAGAGDAAAIRARPCRRRCSRIGKCLSINGFRPVFPTRHRPYPWAGS
jgi:glyoxylase-like metal-dependent hydrolase (beta-lactamase superfamily II)